MRRNIGRVFSVIPPLRNFYGRQVPFILQLLQYMILFPHSRHVRMVKRRAGTPFFLHFGLLFNNELSSFYRSKQLTISIVDSARVIDRLRDNFFTQRFGRSKGGIGDVPVHATTRTVGALVRFRTQYTIVIGQANCRSNSICPGTMGLYHLSYHSQLLCYFGCVRCRPPGVRGTPIVLGSGVTDTLALRVLFFIQAIFTPSHFVFLFYRFLIPFGSNGSEKLSLFLGLLLTHFLSLQQGRDKLSFVRYQLRNGFSFSGRTVRATSYVIALFLQYFTFQQLGPYLYFLGRPGILLINFRSSYVYRGLRHLIVNGVNGVVGRHFRVLSFRDRFLWLLLLCLCLLFLLNGGRILFFGVNSPSMFQLLLRVRAVLFYGVGRRNAANEIRDRFSIIISTLLLNKI